MKPMHVLQPSFPFLLLSGQMFSWTVSRPSVHLLTCTWPVFDYDLALQRAVSRMQGNSRGGRSLTGK